MDISLTIVGAIVYLVILCVRCFRLRRKNKNLKNRLPAKKAQDLPRAVVQGQSCLGTRAAVTESTTTTRTADDATRGEGRTATTSDESGHSTMQGDEDGDEDGGGDVTLSAESIILSAGGAESMILSACAESMILSAPRAESMILSARAESIIL